MQDRLGSRIATALLVALVLCAPARASAETEVLTGKHRVVYDIIGPLGVERIVNYKNNGYEIRVLDEPDDYSKRVLVEIDLSPLQSTAGFPITALPKDLRQFLGPEKMIQVGHPDITRKAREVTAGAKTVAEAYDRIANYLRDYITYDASQSVQQDALSVLRTARGSCVGYTTLSIALLRSVGVPARYAHGYLPPGYEWGITQEFWGVKTSGGGYHAWIEVYYPDAGWTFSDGEYSKNFVDPYHLLRYIDGAIDHPGPGDATLSVDEGTTYTLVEEVNDTIPIDGSPMPEKTILARQLGNERIAGAIRGRVRNEQGELIKKGEFIKWNGPRGEVHELNQGEYALVALQPGSYVYSIRAEGYAEQRLTVKIEGKELVEKDIVLQHGTNIQGKITSDLSAAERDSARVLLWQGTSAKVFRLDESQGFAIDGIEPGGYKLTFRVKGRELLDKVVEANAGQTVKLEVPLERRGWIEGKVLDSSGNALPRAKVYIKDGKVWTGTAADSTGRFIFYGVEDGQHELMSRLPDKSETRASVQVDARGGANVDLRF
ncbi:MAG: transglutaminase domain-containing protein [Chrysiogenetes bacterium]|nr:transglutaminase domain-containing protein [Chrysiogenetes bacterium]